MTAAFEIHCVTNVRISAGLKLARIILKDDATIVRRFITRGRLSTPPSGTDELCR
jgi:CRISPR/Cas system CMR subunit Cmr4 (Cas7 group RAMP superfamily)